VVLTVMAGTDDGNTNRHAGHVVQEERRLGSAWDTGAAALNSRKTSLRLNLF
jgi:hypothetical protein